MVSSIVFTMFISSMLAPSVDALTPPKRPKGTFRVEMLTERRDVGGVDLMLRSEGLVDLRGRPIDNAYLDLFLKANQKTGKCFLLLSVQGDKNVSFALLISTIHRFKMRRQVDTVIYIWAISTHAD